MADTEEEAEPAEEEAAERGAARAEAKETAASGQVDRKQINKTRFATTAARKDILRHSAGQNKNSKKGERSPQP